MRARLHDKRLYWRGDTLWCRVLGTDGRVQRKTTKCHDEPAASKKADEFERAATDPTYAAALSTTLGGALTAFFADLDRRGRSDATKAKARQKVGHFVRLWGASMPLVRVTAALVLEYIDRRQRETAKDITIKDELGHLGQTLKLARHVGTFHEQRDRIFPPFFSAKHKPKSRWPTPAEMAALVPHLEEHRAAQIVYILATGCRREESFRARRQDTQWSRRLVHVHGTKTEASYDDVPITAVTELLLQWSLERAPGRDRLFRPWGNLSRDLAAACVRACIPRLTPNDLRRGFAKWHVLAGVSQNATSKLLRHTTDKLAQTTYARVTGQEVAALVGPQIRALPDLRFLGFEPAGSPACAPPAGCPVALPPATPIAALGAAPVGADAVAGALIAAPLPTFTGVPILYRATDQTTPSVPNALHQTAGKQAPPREFESLTFALGKRCSIQLSYGGLCFDRLRRG